MAVQTFTDFDAALEAATSQNLSLCGTFRDETPVYFLADRRATADDLRELSFEVQNGREMSDDERGLLAYALKQRPEAFNADLDEVSG